MFSIRFSRDRASWRLSACITLSASALLPISHTFAGDIAEIVVTAQKLADARNGIQTRIGASTYSIDSAAIERQPGGEDNPLNQIVLQAPGAAQDSFGQLHIRGEHNNLQYRLDGVILPEGLSVFSQVLNPRLAEKVDLITGALPAEYGLRTAGIVDIATKGGMFQPGGEISFYGGSHDTLEPSIEYMGSSGRLNYFLSGQFLQSRLGIESPDGSSTPLHDRTHQAQGFGYIEDILDGSSKLSAFFGTSHATFQIPNQTGLSPSLGLSVLGQRDFASAGLNEYQREITHYGAISYLHSEGPFDLQISLYGRYSSLNFTPDETGDLLFDGIAQSAYRRDVAGGLQTEGVWRLADAHTLRGGLILQLDRTVGRTGSLVLPAAPPSDVPVSIADDTSKVATSYSVYLQDEWQIVPALTLNYGARVDYYRAFRSESQISPRANLVWKVTPATAVHVGYARYFSPPPFELVANTTIDNFIGTTAAPPTASNDAPKAERANYFDLGVSQRVGRHLTFGIDVYYKRSRNLVDEGQFGAPVILTPFNYAEGKQYGIELTASYNRGSFSAYGNFAASQALGRRIVSSQFNFDPADLAYIESHWIHLDHDQTYTGTLGASYEWRGTRASADLLYGSGLRAEGATPNGRSLPDYVSVNLGLAHTFQIANAGSLTLRFDVINLFDEVYEIRDGTGVGVGAPQFGARRGFFGGISKSF